jgi:glycosyltransferase involved in cell wall biosynthesis
MRIGINASFLRKQDTGLGQVTANFLKELMELERVQADLAIDNLKIQELKKIEVILYLEEDVKIKLPKNTAASVVKFSKQIFLPLYKRDDLIRRIWWEKFLLPQKVKQDKCDIFLSLYQSATILTGKTKHLMVVHDLIPKFFPNYLNNWRKKIYQNLVEKAIKKVDKLIAISHRTEKDLITKLQIDPKKITVSYIDVDPLYKQQFSSSQLRKVLKKYKLEPGYLYSGGGLEVRKNVESVVRAYKLLLDSVAGAERIPKLVIFGKLLPQLAPLVTDAEKLIGELGLAKQVVLLGQVPQADLPALYASALVFIYPSFYEGFGLPILEAMNQGTPVITSKTSSLPEVGRDSVLYCDPKYVEDLAMVLKNVLANNHLKIALSLKGRERAAHFSWEKFVRKFLNIIGELK